MKTKTLKVIFEVPGTTVTSARVVDHGTNANSRPLEFTDGRDEEELPPGKYVLQWRAKGAAPKTEYTIKITAPPEALFDPDPPKRSTPKGNIEGQKTFIILP